jgi:hypothetical protein
LNATSWQCPNQFDENNNGHWLLNVALEI